MSRLATLSDPSRDAAALLRRLGFATLVLTLPFGSMFFRRGTVILLPIGVALLVAAAALDGQYRALGSARGRLLGSTALLATAFGLVWAGVSIVWSPAPALSGERFVGLASSLALGLAAHFALPDRMRSANLYLIPIGVGIAAIAALAAVFLVPGLTDPEDDGRSFERGMSILVLFLWPAIAWLRSRQRDGQGVVLVALVALAAFVAPQPAIAVALALGALAFVGTSLAPRPGALLTASIIAAVLLVAPVVPLLLPGGPAVPNGGLPGWRAGLEAARQIMSGQPVRLLTGHGFGALLSARIGGTLPANAPDTPVVQLWYDLGLVGALAVAAAVWTGLRDAATSYAPVLPGIAGAMACAFTLACAAMGSAQAWQPIALAVLALSFVAIERGQFRTRRPPASLTRSQARRGA